MIMCGCFLARPAWASKLHSHRHSTDRHYFRKAVLTTKTFLAKTDDGSEERIKIELGNHSVFPVNTELLVTHDAKVAARTERIMFMRDGKIVSEMRLPKFSGRDIDERMKKVTAKMREIGI